MDLSDQLSAFLSAAGAPKPFRIGYWLEVIDGQTLACLRASTESFISGDIQKDPDDLISVVFSAMAAETRQSKLETDEQSLLQWMKTLRLTTQIESFRRKGWVLVGKPLSIQPNAQMSLQITNEGMRHSDELRNARR